MSLRFNVKTFFLVFTCFLVAIEAETIGFVQINF